MLPLSPPLPPLLLLMDMEPELETNDSPDLMFIIPPVVPFSAVKLAKISMDPPGPFKDFPTLMDILPAVLSRDAPLVSLISPELSVADSPL